MVFHAIVRLGKMFLSFDLNRISQWRWESTCVGMGGPVLVFMYSPVFSWAPRCGSSVIFYLSVCLFLCDGGKIGEDTRMGVVCHLALSTGPRLSSFEDGAVCHLALSTGPRLPPPAFRGVVEKNKIACVCVARSVAHYWANISIGWTVDGVWTW